MKGYVYVISNPAMPRYIKVGFSTKDPALRATEFNTASPEDYVVDYEVLIDDPRMVEKEVHQKLDFLRTGKEWFECDVVIAVKAIRKACDGKSIYYESLRGVFKPALKENFATPVDAAIAHATEVKPVLPSPVQKPTALVEQIKKAEKPQGGAVPADKTTSSVAVDPDRLRGQAEAGDMQAQFELGRRLDTGDGVRKSLKESFRWYKAAADQGHIDACVALARAYWSGRGLEKEPYDEGTFEEKQNEKYAALAQYARKPAELGNAEAMFLLSEGLYFVHYDCWQAREKRVEDLRDEEWMLWRLHAVEAGHPAAQYWLAGEYAYPSYGFSKDMSRAFDLMQKSASQGYARAIRGLGDFYAGDYYEGWDGEVNKTTARHYYQLAGDKGDQTAKKRLAYMDMDAGDED